MSFIFGSGGGGSAATISLPDEMSVEYVKWLGTHAGSPTDPNVWDAMKAAFAADPFALIYINPTDPGGQASLITEGIETYRAEYEVHDVLGSFTTAWQKISTDLLTPTTGILAKHLMDALGAGVKTAADAHVDGVLPAGFVIQGPTPGNIASMGTNAATEADTVGRVEKVDYTALVDTLVTAAIGDINAITAGMRNAGNYHALYTDVVTEAVAKADECGVLKNIDLEAIVQVAMKNASRELLEAVTGAVEAVDDTIIAAAVTSYRNSIKANRSAEFRKFAGHMADINAVHGSSFVIGSALIHRQTVENADEYEATLRKETFDTGLKVHVESFRTTLASKLQAEITNKTARDKFITDSIQLMQQTYINELTQYVFEIDRGLQAAQFNATERNRILGQFLEIMNAIYQALYDYEKHAQELYLSSFGQYLQDTQLRDKSNWDFENFLFRENTKNLYDRDFAYLGMRGAFTDMLHRTYSTAYVMETEFKTNENEREYKDAMFDLEVWSQGAVVMGIPTGMTGIVPRGANKSQTALSGMFAGAQVGAGVGGVPGALIGGALGLLGGGFLG